MAPTTYRALPPPPTVQLLAELDELVGPEGYDEMFDDIEREFQGVDLGPSHYDRHGEPINMRTWMALFHLGMSYRQIAYTEVGPYHVSTIWLGLDHGMNYPPRDDYKPWIFEAMVFANEWSWHPEKDTAFGKLGGFHYHEDFEQRRYNSEQAALDDHEEIVAEINLLLAAAPDWKPSACPSADTPDPSV